MPDKTELVLHDADGEVLDKIATTLPSEISSLRGRGYSTAEEYEQLAQAREALAKSDADPTGNSDDPGGDETPTTKTTPAPTGGEDASKKATSKGGKGPSATGR